MTTQLQTSPSAAPDAPLDELPAPRKPLIPTKIRYRLYSVVLFVFLMLAWDRYVVWFDVREYLLPRPLDVAEAFIRDFTDVRFWTQDVVTTLTEVAIGFGIAVTAATVLAFVMAATPALDKLVYPYVVTLQSMPKIALAPLIIIWLGYGIQSKIAIVTLIAFFPIFVNVLAGSKSVDRDQVLLFKSLRATRWQTIVKLRFRAILPFFLAGVDIGIILALLGAIVGEFLGSTVGLGSLVVQRQGYLDIIGMFSVLVFLALFGNVLHLLIGLAHKRFAAWADQRENHETY